MQERLAPQLRAFDRDLEGFRERSLCSGLSATIRSLSTEGPVIDALKLQYVAPHRYQLVPGRTAQVKKKS